MSRARLTSIVSHTLVGLALVLLTILRAQHPGMSRPFEVDELLTVEYYTWVGLTESGEVRQLNHIGEYYALPQPTFRHALMGIYCSVGRWPEPTNHILNSLLVSASLIRERSERAARLPALVGLAVFAFALYWLCGPVLGWRFAAPLVAAWAWFCPFLVAYGLRARGYTWMLALQVLFLLAMKWLAQKPGSVARGAVCGGLAIITFLNIVNMAIDWVLPAYLAFFLRPPSDFADGDRTAWRRNILAQVLGVGAVGLMFLVSHLPSVYSASQQTGQPFSSFGELLGLLAGSFGVIFPTLAWRLFGALAIVGLTLSVASRRTQWISSLALCTLAIGLVHFLIAYTLPYERGLTYVLPLAMLGTAYLLEYAIRWPARLQGRILVWTAAAGLSLVLAMPAFHVELSNQRLNDALELARQLEPSTGLPTFMLRDNFYDHMTAMYRPRQWLYVKRLSPTSSAQIVEFVEDNGIQSVNRGGAGGASWNAKAWQYHRYFPNAPVSMVQIVGEVRAFPESTFGSSPRALFFWYPDPTRLGVRGDEQLRYAAASGLRFIVRGTRYAAKLDVFANVESIVFIAESIDEYRQATATVRTAIERLGGTALVFVPRER